MQLEWDHRPEGVSDHRKLLVGRSENKFRETAIADAVTCGQEQRCRLPASQKNSWITSSTSYMTLDTYSRIAASSLNHGSPVPESIFSLASSFTPQ